MLLKVVLLLVVVLSAFAQNPLDTGVSLFSWTGTTTGATTFRQPTTANSNQGCSATTIDTRYRAFNFNFSTPGVREIALLVEPGFKSSVIVYLYNGSFTATASCNNYTRQLTQVNFPDGLQGSLTVDDAVYFLSGVSYTIVVTSTVAGAANTGIFGLQIQSSFAVGSTVGGVSWVPTTLDTGLCAPVTTGNQTASIVSFTNNLDSGLYDIVALFDAGSITLPTTYLSIYTGSYTVAQLQNAPCGYAMNISIHEGDRIATGVAQSLTRFQIYTAVISSSYTGNWAIQVVPTRIRAVNTLSGYNQPARATTTCSASTFNNSAWAVVSIPQAVGGYYLVESNPIPTYNPFYLGFPPYLFGFNGTLSTTTAPPACPAGSSLLGSAGNTTGPVVLTTTAGRAYSIVITTDNGGPLTVLPTPRLNGVFIYIFAPTTNPNTNPTTTGALTSSTGGSNVTTSSISTSTTGDAAAIGFPMLLVAAGVLLHLLL